MHKRLQQLQKIQNMSRLERTQLFWEVSKAYCQGTGPLQGITTEKALGILSDLEDSPSLGKNLDTQVTALLDAIISGQRGKQVPKLFGNAAGMMYMEDYTGGEGPKAA